MLHAHVVAATERIAIIMPRVPGNIRVAKFIPVVRIRASMILDILVRPFDPVMETLPLDIAVLTRRLIPSITTLSIARTLRWTILLSDKDAGASEKCHCQCWCYQPCKFHCVPFGLIDYDELLRTLVVSNPHGDQ